MIMLVKRAIGILMSMLILVMMIMVVRMVSAMLTMMPMFRTARGKHNMVQRTAAVPALQKFSLLQARLEND